MRLRRIAGVGGGIQVGLGLVQLGLGGGNVRVQRGDLGGQRLGIGLTQILYVFLIAGALGNQPVALDDGLLALRTERVSALAVFQRGQLLLQLLLLRAEVAHLRLESAQQRLLLVGHVHQALHLFERGVHLVELRLKLGALGGELLDGRGQLRFAAVELALRLVQLGQRAALGAGQLILAVGNLRLRIVELLLHVGQLGVDVAENGVVQHIDAILLDGHVDLLRDQARRGDGRHAVDGFILGDERFFNVFRQREDVHIVHRHGYDRHRQHVGIDLHDGRRADIVAPRRGEGRDFGVDFDHRGVQVGGVVELHHDQREVVAGGGRNLLDVGQRGKGGLHRSGDLGFHLFGRCADIGRIHDDIGKIHAGQQICGHICKGYDAQYDDKYDADCDGIWFFDAVFSEHNGLRQFW